MRVLRLPGTPQGALCAPRAAWIDFGRHFGSLGLPFGSQYRSQHRSRLPLEHRELPGACPRVSGLSKITKIRARSEPKTLKINHLVVSRLQKRSPGAPNMESQNARFLKIASDLGNPKWSQKKSNIKPNKPKIRTQTIPNMAPMRYQNIQNRVPETPNLQKWSLA